MAEILCEIKERQLCVEIRNIHVFQSTVHAYAVYSLHTCRGSYDVPGNKST
ncbi:hypothetical protein DPMN_024458 [Dreissena polymorpha]|uniref:Uncharacterized protein n=1 Tax=Dreissena polymorpha TaxID=45954 RepID=A0A9D4RAT0_DREPO|nr:hypothetical protein DPMN_024458 [Dreissena polymorpha]